ncbi:DUF6701 domain-containing protein [Methylobacter psychrophilus]|uniref:DUF6701 domain-containing protein n=1 Tax=Methylobacter psychrophilus TaxID=96941 RepID=UPI0021D503C7|nr:DUF6701 domain-containing protein [Methylobacter psychrophilus]
MPPRMAGYVRQMVDTFAHIAKQLIIKLLFFLGMCQHKLSAISRFFLVCPLWCVFLFAIGPTCVYGAWFNATWHYRVPVNIPATATVNSTVKVDVDFTALLASLGVAGTFDGNSPRVVRSDDLTLSTNQQYTDTVYADATDAAGNSRGEIRFILQNAGPATYYLYFDVASSGLKAANPQIPINGNFEFGAVAGANPQIPPGWAAATRSKNTMDSQIRPAEAPVVIDQTTVTTNGNPYTGAAAYLQGFRSATDAGGNGVLTKSLIIPASNPGSISVRIRPEGWHSAKNGNTTSYDFIRVRLLKSSTVKLDIVGPALNNYATCPFSPNYFTSSTISSTTPGSGLYNYWDNGSGRNNHTLGMSALYNRGLEPWVTCTASLAGVAGQTLTLEIRSNYVASKRSWFLIDDLEWSVVTATLGSPTASAVAAIVPANFNCVEAGNDSATGRLYTKLVGSPFNFDVVALKADSSVNTGYVAGTSKTATIELVDGSAGIDCASRAALLPAISQTLSFSATDLGRKAIAPITLGKAYPNLRCRVTDANQSPSIVGCSSDNFAVRPSGLTVTSSINADAAGLGNSAAPVLKTGDLFTLTAESGVAGYNTTPSLDGSKVNAHIGAAQVGTLVGDFDGADPVNGTATGSIFTYSEVGYFNLATNGVYDDSFTAEDSAVNDCTDDFSNSLVGGKVGCKFGNTAETTYFGRFIPDHFDITPGSITPACSSSFTYFGQDGFSTSFTLIAQNADDTTTQNYHGGFARLGLTAWSMFNFSSPGLPAGSLLSASITLPVGVWSQGVANVTAKHQVSRPTALTGETSVVVQAAPIDLDGVTMSPTAVADPTPLRYGRLLLQNAYGSELMALPVSLTAQYWNGSAFVLNTDDSCTSVVAPASGAGLAFYPEVATTAQGNHLSATEISATVSTTGKLVTGDGGLKFSAPGIGNDGYLDIRIQVPIWLKFDWNATTAGDEYPSARAAFGIYKGNDSQIYLREVY